MILRMAFTNSLREPGPAVLFRISSDPGGPATFEVPWLGFYGDWVGLALVWETCFDAFGAGWRLCVKPRGLEPLTRVTPWRGADITVAWNRAGARYWVQQCKDNKLRRLGKWLSK